MPELPEIESIKRVIEPQIQGLAIDRVTVNRPEVIANPDAAEFCGRVSGQSFAGMERRGKFLIFSLESGDRLIVQHIVTKGTIDERIIKALSQKEHTQTALIDAVKADLKI